MDRCDIVIYSKKENIYIFISRPLFSGMFKSEYKDNAYLLLTELTVKERTSPKDTNYWGNQAPS